MTHYSHISTYCLSEKNQKEVAALCEKLAPYEALLAAGKDPQATPILNLCASEDDIAEIETLAAQIRTRFAYVIICGAGGSGLSGRVLTNLRLYAASPTLYTLDNIDPSAIAAVIEHCPPAQTLVIAISKSGSAASSEASSRSGWPRLVISLTPPT